MSLTIFAGICLITVLPITTFSWTGHHMGPSKSRRGQRPRPSRMRFRRRVVFSALCVSQTTIGSQVLTLPRKSTNATRVYVSGPPSPVPPSRRSLQTRLPCFLAAAGSIDGSQAFSSDLGGGRKEPRLSFLESPEIIPYHSRVKEWDLL